MILERIFTPGLAQVGYLVGDEEAGVAAAIDPRRDAGEFVALAARLRVKIVAVLETHVHADFVSGALELASATGAPIYLSEFGEQRFAHVPMRNAENVDIGRLRLQALWTPGHTPEHMAYLLIDRDKGDDPIALFSGDALFVGDVGRPDLLGEDQTRKLAERLYYTVTDRLSRLDDAVVVYPGHTGGSSCGKKIGDDPQTTIGRERVSNYAFAPQDRDAFVSAILDGMPPPPTYYPHLKRVNAAGAAPLGDLPDGRAIDAAGVARMQTSGALVVDARDPEAFGAGHVPGAFFAGLGPNFLPWMGWLAPYDRDLVLVLDDETRYEEARTELRRIGLDRVAGYLDGGMDAWRADAQPVECLPQLSVCELADRLAGKQGRPVVLDVRSDDEWRAGHIAGAAHRFGGELAQGAAAPEETAAARDVAVICGSGYRSSVAASVLLARGQRNLINVAGGMGAWSEAGLPTTKEEAK